MASGVFHQLYYHFAWATRERLPVITDEVNDWLVQCVESGAVKWEGRPLACNAMPDHVHLLVGLEPTACVATFIGKVKGSAAYAFNREFAPRHQLTWQDGYGVVAFRESETPRVIEYILNQQEIHAARKISRLLETTGLEETQP